MNTIYDIAELSFPDQKAWGMSIDHAQRRLSICLSGAWLNGSVAPGELVIHDWQSLRQRRFQLPSRSWDDLSIGCEEPIKDIAEMTVEEKQIVIRGFGEVTGQWLEITCVSAKGEYQITGGEEGGRG